MKLTKKSIFILLALALFLIAGVYAAIQLKSFELLRTSAQGNIINTYDKTLEYEFNDTIATDTNLSSENIIIYPKYKVRYIKIDNNKLIFTLNEPSKGASLKILIKEIKSNSNKSIHNIENTYTIRLLEDTNENKTNLSIDTYPILSVLPISTNEYTIHYLIPERLGQDEDVRIIVTITVLGINDDVFSLSKTDKEYMYSIRQKAIEDLESRGFTADDYVLLDPEALS